uniref:Uncharacterized protein n=1 Tax=Rhizophagus irregularis (strain DAOM 181602 / DAOM 197198 / MUCL 43194) TaxID=747089 RepID=U9SNE0_RHIID
MSVAKNGIQIAVLAKLIEILIQFIMKYQNNTGLDIKEIHHEIRRHNIRRYAKYKLDKKN